MNLTTDLAIKNLKLPTEKDFIRHTVNARGVAKGTLLLKVTSRGIKTFYCRAVFEGKRIDLKLGRYGVIGLKEAVDLHNKYIVQIEKGIDPRNRKPKNSNTPLEHWTVQELYSHWLQHLLRSNITDLTKHEHQRRYSIYVKPVIGQRKLSELSRKDIAAVMDQGRQRSVEQTRKCLSTLNQMFKFGLMREYIESSPCAGFTPKDFYVSKASSRERFLSLEEINLLFDYLTNTDGTKLSEQTRLLIIAAVFTGCRRGELSKMRWEELSNHPAGALWSIPSNKTKNSKPHKVLIHKTLLSKLKAMATNYRDTTTEGFVFASIRSPEEPIRADVVTRAISRFRALLDMPAFTFHDLRRSFATHLNELFDIDASVVELMLNHVPANQLIKTYQRVEKLDKQLDAWEIWGNYLAKVLGEGN